MKGIRTQVDSRSYLVLPRNAAVGDYASTPEFINTYAHFESTKL